MQRKKHPQPSKQRAVPFFLAPGRPYPEPTPFVSDVCFILPSVFSVSWIKIREMIPYSESLILKVQRSMQEFITYLIKNLVDKPDLVNVQVRDEPEGMFIDVQVSPEDVAKVVGRQGRTIKSLRTLVMTVGARFGRKVRLELIQ